MRDPIRYAPDIERPEAEEEQTERLLCRALTEILDTTSGNYGHAVRAVHAKSHGIFEARFEILPDLPPELAQGLFARPGRHPALVRISTNPGDLLPDSVSVPRGLALKILEVEGERLAHAEGDTQDFVMVNGPAFAAPDAASFLKSLNRLARTTDQATWAKVALSSVLRGAEKVLEAAGGESATLKTMGGAPNVHPLGESYFSQTAFRHGDFIAKYQLVPVSGSLTRLTGEGDPRRRRAGRAARACGAGSGRRRRLGVSRPALPERRDDAGRGSKPDLERGGEPLRDGGAPDRTAAAGLERSAGRGRRRSDPLLGLDRACRAPAAWRDQPRAAGDLQALLRLSRGLQPLPDPRAGPGGPALTITYLRTARRLSLKFCECLALSSPEVRA